MRLSYHKDLCESQNKNPRRLAKRGKEERYRSSKKMFVSSGTRKLFRSLETFEPFSARRHLPARSFGLRRINFRDHSAVTEPVAVSGSNNWLIFEIQLASTTLLTKGGDP